jgi:hypothetical protein
VGYSTDQAQKKIFKKTKSFTKTNNSIQLNFPKHEKRKRNRKKKKKTPPDHIYAQINSIPSPPLTLLKPKNNLKEAVGRGVERVDEVREHQRHEHQHVCNPLVN